MNTKKIIIAARVMSAIFTPFYLPIVGLVALFVFSYLGLLPWAYKLLVLGMVYLFTISCLRCSSTSTTVIRAGHRCR